MANLVKQGKTKQMFTTDDPEVYRVHYTNHTTAGDGLRNELINKKGEVNNKISSLIFKYLDQKGIKTDFIKQLSDTDQLNRKVTMIPLEVVARNHASGSIEKRFGLKHLLEFKKPVEEFYYKSDELHDPIINDSEVEEFGILTGKEIDWIRKQTRLINQDLKALFAEIGIILVDFKVEYGKTSDGHIILADEISPDSCRLVDAKTKKSLDKDVFRKRLGNMMVGYDEVLNKLETVLNK
ncbi:phosphoribosylaminoimidazole-succinocarboxamide synthase [Philodulcilactobacillus myokoensis]|uniref:Phosphoribosylaminoimidazole-succinocarboxamide synthase n=1 Tax=Philodulcilactobacillus myokoensis TaxID=2929573 RepID=A0A9W6ETV0_9LACO|nr:phosphoribosylaminoimidazolesuccinocarboxamide synthase [Philodulcilactobacillus myokoensis]GLB47453.1 phosphoribosylaminoimidazole-succinocarboxamide synthase [Philodulcilactobacillus myokoensis]